MTTVKADEVASIRVELPAGSNALMTNICSVFARQVASRCGAQVVMQGEAPLTVALSIDGTIGKEGFRIRDRAAGAIEVAGQNERGVLYGLGKLLRTSRYSEDGFTPGAWRGESVPKKSARGIYFATHFYNFYQEAPVEDIQRYVEELALWGMNNLMVWYDMHHFNGFGDPAAVAFRERLAQILKAASDLGLGTGLITVGNEGYGDSPEEMRSQGGKRGGYYKCQVCTSRKDGLEYELKIKAELFDWIRPFKPQYVCIWPFDQGGCDCAECSPWATNGFLKCAKPTAILAREKLPGIKIILANWKYTPEEKNDLGKILLADNSWIDYVMGPVPDQPKPAVNFPEISMMGTTPWGGFGAIPVPEHVSRRYEGSNEGSKMDDVEGGWPYSEGIFEDMNKVLMLQLYWQPTTSVYDIIKEYTAFEFSPETQTVNDVVAMVKILELNFFRAKTGLGADVRPRTNVGSDAIHAFELAEKVNAKLSAAVRKSWRWRILYLRALIDKEMHLSKGVLQGETLKQAFAELTQIYHAEKATKAVKPPQIP